MEKTNMDSIGNVRSMKAEDVVPGREIVVGVGYGWQKFREGTGAENNGRGVLADMFWTSLKDHLKGKCEGVEKSLNVKVNLKRLRASHGRLIWPRILKRIQEADVLVFDLAAAPAAEVKLRDACPLPEIVKGVNHNVLVEVGAALALDKPVILMCPEHLVGNGEFPSDLQGFLLTTYTLAIKDGRMTRVLKDQYGFQNAFIAMLREAALDGFGNC